MKVYLVFLLLTMTHQCFAWGKLGHRIVAKIAYLHLDRVAKIKIDNLIEGENFDNLSTWADEIKSDKKYDFARPYHYINIPKGKKAEDVGGVHLLNILIEMERKLISDKISRIEKKEVFKFFIHLLGDLHNPLHVGYSHDRGGNDFKVKWFGKQTNLHKVWDEKLIEYEKLSYSEYTNALLPLDKVVISRWLKGDYQDWINEQLSIRDHIYPKPGESLGHAYHYKWSKFLDNQLRKAGVRLGNKLNQIFSNR
jgi:hypothetical protein